MPVTLREFARRCGAEIQQQILSRLLPCHLQWKLNESDFRVSSRNEIFGLVARHLTYLTFTH